MAPGLREKMSKKKSWGILVGMVALHQQGDDAVEHDSRSAVDGELVPRGRSSPLLQAGIVAPDDIAARVLDRVELRWPAALGPATETKALLVRRLGDHSFDPA